MNEEKIRKLKAQVAQVRIGGKGTPRRKKKVVVHSSAGADDKKLQTSLKKLSANTIPDIDEANMIKDDGSVIHFNCPKVQASFAANTIAITGHADVKQIPELLPGILQQLGPEGVNTLKRIASNIVQGNPSVASSVAAANADIAGVDDDEFLPQLTTNFDEASNAESTVRSEVD